MSKTVLKGVEHSKNTLVNSAQNIRNTITKFKEEVVSPVMDTADKAADHPFLHFTPTLKDALSATRGVLYALKPVLAFLSIIKLIALLKRFFNSLISPVTRAYKAVKKADKRVKPIRKRLQKVRDKLQKMVDKIDETDEKLEKFQKNVEDVAKEAQGYGDDVDKAKEKIQLYVRLFAGRDIDECPGQVRKISGPLKDAADSVNAALLECEKWSEKCKEVKEPVEKVINLFSSALLQMKELYEGAKDIPFLGDVITTMEWASQTLDDAINLILQYTNLMGYVEEGLKKMLPGFSKILKLADKSTVLKNDVDKFNPKSGALKECHVFLGQLRGIKKALNTIDGSRKADESDEDSDDWEEDFDESDSSGEDEGKIETADPSLLVDPWSLGLGCQGSVKRRFEMYERSIRGWRVKQQPCMIATYGGYGGGDNWGYCTVSVAGYQYGKERTHEWVNAVDNNWDCCYIFRPIPHVQKCALMWEKVNYGTMGWNSVVAALSKHPSTKGFWSKEDPDLMIKRAAEVQNDLTAKFKAHVFVVCWKGTKYGGASKQCYASLIGVPSSAQKKMNYDNVSGSGTYWRIIAY